MERNKITKGLEKIADRVIIGILSPVIIPAMLIYYHLKDGPLDFDDGITYHTKHGRWPEGLYKNV